MKYRLRRTTAAVGLSVVLLLGGEWTRIGGLSYTKAEASSPALSAAAGPYVTRAIPQADKRFIKVEGGSYMSAGLRQDGTVWVWGRRGENGLQPGEVLTSYQAPVRVPGLPAIADLSVSGHYQVYKLAAGRDGSVWQWGFPNQPNALGYNEPMKISGAERVVKVAAGWYFGLALTKEGTVLALPSYGGNLDGMTASQALPVQGLGQIVDIAADWNHAYALDRSGNVWSWSQTIAASSQAAGSGAAKPKKVSGLKRISKLSGNEYMLLALDQKGKAWKIENGGKAAALQPKMTFTQVKAGPSYQLLLTSKGEVYQYGRTVTGKQGLVTGLSGIRSIGAGNSHSLAIDAHGRVWGWGAGKYHETGNAPTAEGSMTYRPELALPAVETNIDGRLFTGFTPVIARNDTLLLPMRALAEQLGATFTINVDPVSAQTVYIFTLKEKSVSFSLGQNRLTTPHGTITLSAAPVLVENAVMIPPDLLTKGFGMKAEWKVAEGLLTLPR